MLSLLLVRAVQSSTLTSRLRMVTFALFSLTRKQRQSQRTTIARQCLAGSLGSRVSRCASYVVVTAIPAYLVATTSVGITTVTIMPRMQVLITSTTLTTTMPVIITRITQQRSGIITHIAQQNTGIISTAALT